MVYTGELCGSCGNQCSKEYGTGYTAIECPICDGTGLHGDGPCEHCSNGTFQLRECPRRFIGSEMIEAVNIASMCGKGDWPVSGGLMDQSAWFIELMQRFKSERNKIETEKLENVT